MSENLHQGEKPADAAAWRRWSLLLLAIPVLLILAGIGVVLLEPAWTGGHDKRVAALVAELELAEANDWLTNLIREYFPEYGARRDPDEVAGALAALGPDTVHEIITAAGHRLASVRLVAAKALGRIGDPRAVPLLVDLLARDPESRVRGEAAFSLGQLGGPQALVRLIEAMADSDPNIRNWAAIALGDIGDPAAVDPLLKAMTDADRDVRAAAAGALGDISDPRATMALAAALKDSDSYIRSEAACPLGLLRDPRAADALLSARSDSEESVRRATAFALALHKRPEAIPILAEVFTARSTGLFGEEVPTTGTHDWHAVAAVVGLAQIGTPDARQALAQGALKAVDPAVRRLAARALEVPVVEAMAEELRGEDETLQWHIIRAFVYLRDPASLPILEEALKSPDWIVRYEARKAIRLIRRANPPQATPAPALVPPARQ
jgi:HEAT repeat protein